MITWWDAYYMIVGKIVCFVWVMYLHWQTIVVPVRKVSSFFSKPAQTKA